ncbi:ABC-type transport system involved in resistance to organic solvents, auxiliary component [SAR116 cluster alpha proteobacterium HIMB100]|nr:ABC-type transport system involved in resistance to organic solvents, auxiliary component [SAR116 cluster alpha proteobacterium HIMB100]
MIRNWVEIMRAGLFGLFLTVMAVLPAQANDRVAEAEQLVSSLISALETNLMNDSSSDEENKQFLNQLVDTYFDVEGITRFSVGRYWRIATADERKTYARLFRSVLLNQASSQFHQLKNLEFKPTTSKARGEKLVLVGGIIHDKSGEFPDVEMFWRVVTLPDKPAKIFDVEIENISMLKTQQDENTTLIRRNGGRFAALNEALQEQLAQQQTN